MLAAQPGGLPKYLAGGNGRLTPNPPESIDWNFMRRGLFGTLTRSVIQGIHAAWR
jgi:CRP-like cAMP-binding protein